MNKFAELLDRLAYEPGRNNKLRLLTSYFQQVADPDRGYALAALTGALSFKHAKPGLIRDLIAGAAPSDTADREAHLKKQAQAQVAVPESRLVEAVREVLKRHGIA